MINEVELVISKDKDRLLANLIKRQKRHILIKLEMKKEKETLQRITLKSKDHQEIL
jgi:hypothetical protein